MFQRSVDSFSLRELHCLSRARVAVCGVGAGGCIVSEILVRSGVGFLRLIDGDRFEESNLNRQTGCTQDTLGQYKAEAMASRLKRISKYSRIDPRNEYISDKNASGLLGDVDLVCDTTDGVQNKTMLAHLCKDLSKVEVTGGIGDVYCWTALLVEKSVSDIFRKYQGRSLFANPGTCFLQGALQAQEILNWLCGRNWGSIDKKICLNHKTYALTVEEIGGELP